jgi:hypothetical protein
MAKQLTPRNLDIVITKITDKTVTYELAATRKEEKWRIPGNSTFNKCHLVIGERYHVSTTVIRASQWNQRAQNYLYEDTFDWVTATVRHKKAKLVAMTAKQRKSVEVAASMPLVDESLFSW